MNTTCVQVLRMYITIRLFYVFSRFLIPISSPFGKLFEREVRREEKEVIKGKEEKGKKKAKGTKI